MVHRQLAATARQLNAHAALIPRRGSLTAPGGPLLHTLKGHSNPVNAVAVTSDGRLVVSGSYDGTLKLWELASGMMLATFTADHILLCVATASDHLFVAADTGGTLHIIELAEPPP